MPLGKDFIFKKKGEKITREILIFVNLCVTHRISIEYIDMLLRNMFKIIMQGLNLCVVRYTKN